jgi:hypothetical protein
MSYRMTFPEIKGANLNPENLRRIELLSRVLGIAPRPENVEGGWCPGRLMERPVLVPVPEGWRHVSTGDGVGVLAPISAFAREEPPTMNDLDHLNTPPTWYLEQAERALAAGFPATALLYLRQGYWHHWSFPGVMPPFLGAMRSAYLALGRPLLANVVAQSARRWNDVLAR